MRITGLSAFFIAIFLMTSCSFTERHDAPVPPAQTPIQSEGSPVRAVPVTKVESEIVITPELCAQAIQRDASAQNVIATYYDSMANTADLAPDKDGQPTRSAKAMVAAMYWYDLAIHYDQTNEAAKARRRILGSLSNPDIMEMFRSFTKWQGRSRCMPQDVFEGKW